MVTGNVRTDSCPTVAVRGEGADGGRWLSAPARAGVDSETFSWSLRALQELYLQRDSAWAGTLVAAASSSEEPSYSSTCLDILEILPGVKMREAFTSLRLEGQVSFPQTSARTLPRFTRRAGLTSAKCCFSTIVIGVTTWIKSIERTESLALGPLEA